MVEQVTFNKCDYGSSACKNYRLSKNINNQTKF
jgi:hypothetical protein